jgi:hypothetical protein
MRASARARSQPRPIMLVAGGGRLVALVTDADGNVIGLIQPA